MARTEDQIKKLSVVVVDKEERTRGNIENWGRLNNCPNCHSYDYDISESMDIVDETKRSKTAQRCINFQCRHCPVPLGQWKIIYPGVLYSVIDARTPSGKKRTK